MTTVLAGARNSFAVHSSSILWSLFRVLGHSAETSPETRPLGAGNSLLPAARFGPLAQHTPNYVEAEVHGSKVVAEGGYPRNPEAATNSQLTEIPWRVMEPATGIEPAACGLQSTVSMLEIQVPQRI